MERTPRSSTTERHRSFYGTIAVAAIALPFAIGIARAAENGNGVARGAHTIVIVDSSLLYPGSLTVHGGDVLQFQNYSSESIALTFIEPKNAADDLHCRPNDTADPTAGVGKVTQRPLFTKGPSHDLTVTVPPGRVSSACSLTPGRYVFLTKRIARDQRSSGDTLGYTGTIRVE